MKERQDMDAICCMCLIKQKVENRKCKRGLELTIANSHELFVLQPDQLLVEFQVVYFGIQQLQQPAWGSALSMGSLR